MKTPAPAPINVQRKITVLIADDHSIVREGLRHLLATAPDIEVVGEADNGNHVLTETYRLNPMVIVLDIAMPELNGISAARELARRLPRSKILMLSTYHDDQEVHAAVEAGACSYLMKESAGADLIRAVRETAKGNSFFSPLISQRMLRRTRMAFRNNAAPDKRAPVTELTDREAEVLQLVASGNRNQQIAITLGISVKTVEKHRQSVMDKLHIREAAGLTRYAIARGTVPCVRPLLVPVEEAPPAPQPAALAQPV